MVIFVISRIYVRENTVFDEYLKQNDSFYLHDINSNEKKCKDWDKVILFYNFVQLLLHAEYGCI